MNGPTLRFEGAAQTVTGSRHRIQFAGKQWLFDCGLYQGHRDEADKVNRSFAFDPKALDGVVVSHAHLDHTGNLPTLLAAGWQGPVHATPATAELSRSMLADSAHLMKKDVDRVNRKRGEKRRPLYSPEDVEHLVENFVLHDYHQPFSLHDGVTVEYWDAGHIIGSALTVFEFKNGSRSVRLGMTGDLGRAHRPILRDPEVHPGVDFLVLESTYGDRLHPSGQQTEADLTSIVHRAIERGGRLLVPAFAVGRTQELVATLHALTERGAIPELPIFVDSPLARSATAVYQHHPECFDEQTLAQFRNEGGAPFGFARLRYVGTPEESRALNDINQPCVIIAASGMCEGGRILHHLQNGLPDEKDTVAFVGFQAEGTLGRRISEGAEVVNIFGEPVRRKAAVASLHGFSAHADQAELLSWVGRLNPRPKKIWLVHGEAGPGTTLAGLLHERLGIDARVAVPGEEVTLWN
jgi:metallo-beta-lactamase family protein